MPSIPHPTIPPPPQPTRTYFDPFHSSSTGHQVHKNRMSGSTSWRESRTYKLSHQFRDSSGAGGSKHLSDQVGAGSENYGKDGRKDNGDWEVGAPGLREKGWQDIRGLLGPSRKRKSESPQVENPDHIPKKYRSDGKTSLPRSKSTPTDALSPHAEEAKVEEDGEADFQADPTMPVPQIFRGLTIYLNGSTAPLISDLRLKQMFAQHGGNASLALGRRTVTHVILGDTCGGGLASGKMQKEISTVRGKGIKYVTASWILDSVREGKRQPETKYVPSHVEGKIGGNGQRSVTNFWKRN